MRPPGSWRALLQPRLDPVDVMLRLCECLTANRAPPSPESLAVALAGAEYTPLGLPGAWQLSCSALTPSSRPCPVLPPSSPLLPPPPLSHPLPRHHQTLYRDVVPSYRKHALRGYELYFHLLCWPVPAILAGAATWLGYLGDAGSWCALSLVYTFQYLVCFYLPLLIAFTFNLLTYAAVLAHSRERRVSRITSLYLLGFAVVWLPSLLCRLHVYLSGSKAPPFTLAALEAFCMPLQGALNALVYGWSLPAIRDVYRAMLLGTDRLELGDDRARPPSARPDYSPPQPSTLIGYSAAPSLPPSPPPPQPTWSPSPPPFLPDGESQPKLQWQLPSLADAAGRTTAASDLCP